MSQGVFAKSALEPIEDGGEPNEGEEGGGEFVVASAATMPFDTAEEVFNPMAAAIARAGEGA